MFACFHPFAFSPYLTVKLFSGTVTTCISVSLRRTSAPIHLTSILGVLGTQEISCILIAGLFERDTFDHFLPEFNKPWVIHLRKTCCCSTNLCTWRPNTVYKNRSVRRHHLCGTCTCSYGDLGPLWLHDSKTAPNNLDERFVDWLAPTCITSTNFYQSTMVHLF